jgi:hypothetical protein
MDQVTVTTNSKAENGAPQVDLRSVMSTRGSDQPDSRRAKSHPPSRRTVMHHPRCMSVTYHARIIYLARISHTGE